MHAPASAWSPVLASILEQGSYLILRNFDRQQEVLDKTRALIHAAVGDVQGADAQQFLDVHGLCSLHQVLSADRIGAVRDRVMPLIRGDLFDLTCRIARKLLGIDGEFFVDDYTILRINFPYEVALEAPNNAENPGIGRTDEQTKRAAKANSVVDPVYNPKAYHNNEPPPAWAHGAHQDTWTGHSRFGVNLWWALDEVLAENSMIFYPDTFGRPFAPDPRSLYLAEGYPLPKPSKMALRKGEMLIFNPEMLHSTHLNTSDRTRLAMSTRINPHEPKFSQSCFYAREFWHSSTNLESGRYDQVRRFERAQNLEETSAVAAFATPGTSAAALPCPTGSIRVDATLDDHEWTRICESDRIASAAKLLVQVGEESVLLMRGETRLFATQSRCAHLRVSLADGYHDNDTVYCPAHGVNYALGTGRSACSRLTLRTYAVKEEDGNVWLRSQAKAA